MNILLCPNLLGSDEAPATAKRGAEKKVLTAASIVMSAKLEMELKT